MQRGLNIRKAIPEDLPAVLGLVSELAAFHRDTATLTLDCLRENVLGSTPWLTLLVAERNAVIVGYAALCPLTQLQFGKRGMDIHHLFVSANERLSGIGTALIDASVVEATALGCSYLTVGTHMENTLAQDMYLAKGFAKVTSFGPRFRRDFLQN
jgi:GNAT superfamily N-acetyltransferase